MTDSMSQAIEETNRRRTMQEEYNRQHGIEPRIIKSIRDLTDRVKIIAETRPEYHEDGKNGSQLVSDPAMLPPDKLDELAPGREGNEGSGQSLNSSALLRDQLMELRRAGGTQGCAAVDCSGLKTTHYEWNSSEQQAQQRQTGKWQAA